MHVHRFFLIHFTLPSLFLLAVEYFVVGNRELLATPRQKISATQLLWQLSDEAGNSTQKGHTDFLSSQTGHNPPSHDDVFHDISVT